MFCYQKNFSNPTLPVDEAQFWALVKAAKWNENIDKFRETGDASLKRKLPAFIFQATFDETESANGKLGAWRKQKATRLTGLVVMDLDHIDKVLGQVLGVSHVQLDKLRMIGNPNLGLETRAEDVIEGARKLSEMIGPYKDIDFFTVRRELSGQVSGLLPAPVYPIDLALTYEWAQA